MRPRDSYKVKDMNSQGILMVLVLLMFVKDVHNATVALTSPSPTVTAGVNDLQLVCTVSALAVNETAQSIKLKSTKGDILTFPVSGSPAPVAPWTASSFGELTVTALLPKASVTKDSAGRYDCTAVTTGPTSGTFSASVTITVHYKPVLTISGTTSVKENQALSLTCNVDAVPSSSSVSWKKGSATVSSSSIFTKTQINRSEAGPYTCTATNTAGTTTKTTAVTVYHLDTPTMNSYSRTVKENANVSVQCSVLSMPQADLTITGPNKSKTGTGNALQDNFVAGCKNSGEYRCSATNAEYTETKTRTFNINVLCSPRKDGNVVEKTEYFRNLTQSVVLKATLIANPQPFFKWTRTVPDTGVVMEIKNEPGHFEITNTGVVTTLNITIQDEDDFANYTMEAKNSEGETTQDFFLRTQTVPYGVTVLEMENVTTDSVTVRWLSSFNGGAEQQYVIQYQPMTDRPNGEWTQKITRISDPGRNKYVFARISDIHPGRSYRIRVFSENVFGRSPFSKEIEISTNGVLSVGAGIGIGLAICLVLLAGVVAGIFFYMKRIRPARKKDPQGGQVNPEYNGDTPGEFYSPLNSTRERRAHYDDLNRGDNNVYQNVAVDTNGGTKPPQTQEKVYMNFSSQKSDPESILHGKSNEEVYANT